MNAHKTFRLIRCFTRGLLTLWLLLAASAGHAVERVTYYHNDALGSPVAATDASGTLLWRESYAPYGERLTQEAGNRDTVWYTGKQEEATFGINYFGARWYDPSIGRFMATDPAGFNSVNIQSFNKYVYANNNPYAYVDPDGDFAILGAIVAAVSDTVTQGLLISAGLQQEFSLGSVAIAAGLGAATGGIANIKNAVSAVKIINNAKKGSKVAKGETTVIGRVKDLQNLKQGERSLLDRLPDQGSPKANWKQNSGVLRQEMGKGQPIRDASPGDTSGQFLNAERNLLKDRGWTFDSQTKHWMPQKQ